MPSRPAPRECLFARKTTRNCELNMRISPTVYAVVAFGLPLAGDAAAQSLQTVTFQIDPINQISVSGDPGALAINTAVAGSAPTSVSNSATTWAVTTNQTGSKVTAAIDAPMPPGVTLSLNMQSPNGATSITVSLGTVAADAVTGITKLSESGMAVTYTLSATSTAGTVSSASRTVTLTMVAGS
jgi:hypothetical protein